MATYLVTGANRGIGLEYCRQIKARGEQAIAVCRHSSPELEALGIQIETGVDITDPNDIQSLMTRLSGVAIDILINNAGIHGLVTLESFDPDKIRHLFNVNAVGPLQLTHALLPLMNSGAKIILMTSRMGSIEDNTSGSSYAYRMSKVALSMAGKSLALDLQSRNIAVAILHPGLVQTRMTRFTPNGITPAESVEGLMTRIDDLTLENSGSFWHANGELLPW